MLEPIETVASRRIDDDVFNCAVVRDDLGRGDPIRRGQTGVRLQVVTRRRRWPIDNRGIVNEFDAQHGCAGSLHGVERPEPTSQRIIATGHRAADIGLANGAADGINAAGARAAPAVNRGPVN